MYRPGSGIKEYPRDPKIFFIFFIFFGICFSTRAPINLRLASSDSPSIPGHNELLYTLIGRQVLCLWANTRKVCFRRSVCTRSSGCCRNHWQQWLYLMSKSTIDDRIGVNLYHCQWDYCRRKQPRDESWSLVDLTADDDREVDWEELDVIKRYLSALILPSQPLLLHLSTWLAHIQVSCSIYLILDLSVRTQISRVFKLIQIE